MAKTIYPLPGGDTLAETGPISGPVAFSNGVRVEGGALLFISGQLAFDEQRELVGRGDIREQTRQVLRNVGRVLEQAGGTFRDVVKVTVYIRNMHHFREIHDVRLEFFDAAHLPASTMVEIASFVHPDALVEIDAVAAIGA